MNSDTFCMSRFRHLAVKDIIVNRKKYLLSVASLIGIPVIIILSKYIFNGRFSFHDEVMIFSLILFAFGSIWASVSFSDMGKSYGCIEMMMTPASVLEKFILHWIIAIPLFLLFFVISALISDWLRVELIPDSVPGHFIDVFLHEKDYNHPESLPKYNTFHIFIGCMFFLIQSLFFLGSILWKKLSAIKTFSVLLVLYAIYFGLGALIMHLFLTEDFYIVHNFTDSIVLGIIPLFTLLIYYITYVRLKEMEIINRW